MQGERHNLAEKDLTEKYLETFHDVFADIVNVLLFGEQVIHEDELEDGPTESTYKAQEKNIRNQFRDTSKFYRNSEYKLALLGIENESRIDKEIPIRIMGYDYTAYRAQIDGEEKRKYPVITIILNFSDTEWKSPLSLFDILDIPVKIRPYANDYKIHVFNIAFLPKETRNMFKSDFKVVADFFTEKRLGIYNPKNHQEAIKHVEAVLNMLRVFTNDETYDKIEERIIQTARKGKVITMCSFAEEMTNKGIAQGIEIGKSEGIEIGKINVAKNLLDLLTDEVIAERVGLDIEVVRALRS